MNYTLSNYVNVKNSSLMASVCELEDGRKSLHIISQKNRGASGLALTLEALDELRSILTVEGEHPKIWLLGGKVAKFYGEYDAFIVRAESPETARKLAIQFIKKDAGGDNSESFRTCPIREVTTDGPSEVILDVYRYG